MCGEKGRARTRDKRCDEALKAICPLLFPFTYVSILCEWSPWCPHTSFSFVAIRVRKDVLFCFILLLFPLALCFVIVCGHVLARSRKKRYQEDCSEAKNDRKQKETIDMIMPFPPLLAYLTAPLCASFGLLACFSSFLLYYSSVNASLFCFLAFARPFAPDD